VLTTDTETSEDVLYVLYVTLSVLPDCCMSVIAHHEAATHMVFLFLSVPRVTNALA